MVEHWRRWDDMPLDERIRRNYPVDEETAHLIGQRFLELALTGLDAGVTVRSLQRPSASGVIRQSGSRCARGTFEAGLISVAKRVPHLLLRQHGV
jgi:hypothetical protein